MNTTAVAPYLDRIHFSAQEGSSGLKPSLRTLRDVHTAHLLTVPFENLSIHYGQPIVLHEEALYEKVVRRRRGGFCYELNGLFARLLQSLGFQVTLLSAGVAGAGGDFSPDFDHLTLLVHHLDGADWLADVGFGDSFRLPLRVEADMEQTDADGRVYRLLREETASEEQPKHDAWIMQRFSEGTWESQYRFTLQPHTLIDFTERCHYQQTSPESHFTQKRICTLAVPTGRITVSDLRLITTTHGTREEQIIGSEEEYRDVLARRFGIVI